MAVDLEQWIFIPEISPEKNGWVGKIKEPDKPKSSWKFEAIREVSGHDTYSVTPFDNNKTVTGLIDGLKPCTLVNAFVRVTDPGGFGVRYEGSRTCIEGSFSALITELAISNAETPKFLGFSFNSKTLLAWRGDGAVKKEYDYDARKYDLDLPEEVIEKFDVTGFGNGSCRTGISVNTTPHSGEIESYSIFRFEYDKAHNLSEVIEHCHAVELLFGFLIGFKRKLPSFNIWTNDKYQLDDKCYPCNGTLEISGVYWQEDKLPHFVECINHYQAAEQCLVDNT